MQVLKQLQITIPFTDALAQMPTCRIEVFDPSKEKKGDKNIKENLPEEIIRHDDSENTSRAKDRAFRAAHGNINSLSNTLKE
jgi:hypothetical protein